MNRVYGEGKNGKVVICVLEPGNIHKLVEERKPIEFSLNDGPWKHGLPAKVSIAIAYSETPIADSKQIREMMPDAHFTDTRTPTSKSKLPHCPECRSTIEQLGVFKNESAIALVMCAVCGCVFGTVPSDAVKELRP
jgi:hypothetical protein